MADFLRRGVCVPLVITVLSFVMWSGGVRGEERPPAPPPSPQDRMFDLLLSAHVSGVQPLDRDLSVGGSRIPDTDVRGTIGAGIKFDLYPWFTRKMLGAEFEVFGLGASLRAPRSSSGSAAIQAQGSVVVLSTMYNLMLRYPGNTIQPYVGIGVGSSAGVLYNVNIQNGNTGLSGHAADVAFAYQFLGGVRAFVTPQLFLFGEYKYYVTRYEWDSQRAGQSNVTFDFRTQIVSGGVGWSF